MARSGSFSGVLSVVIGLASIGAVAWWMQREPPAPAPPPPFPGFSIPVTTVPLVVGDVREQIELTGDVVAPERARIAFERAGRLAELAVRLGDRVEAGGLLARLDDEPMEAQIRAAEATLAQAREGAALATRDAERARKIEGVALSQAELDRADSVARTEAQRVTQMESDLEAWRARLRQGTLTAPFAALVTARPVALGSYVGAGDVCCELLSLERREVLIEIPATVAAMATAGAPVTLTSEALPGLSLAVRMTTVLPSEDARARSFTGVVRLEAADDPEHRLLPGIFVRARLDLRTATGELTVPVNCVIENDQGLLLAMVVKGDAGLTAAFVPVRVLARDAERAAVAPAGDAPLAAGDLVILTGKENVFPGAPLTATPGEPGQGGA